MRTYPVPRTRTILRAAACAVLLAVLALPAQAHPAPQDANLLVNGGFEWPYNQDFRTDGGGFVAHGWNAWWYNDPGGDYDAPEFKGASIEEDANRVRDGVVAQQYFRPWARHLAGLWQRVQVPANSHVKFTVWGHAWSTFCAQGGPGTPGLVCDPRNSFHGGVNNITMKVGIDPTGGTDAMAATVVWSAGQAVYDNYQQFAIEANAQGDFVTVFVYSSPEWAAPVISIYWDNAVLIAGGGQPPTNTPRPVSTGQAPRATVASTATETPSAESTSSPAPVTPTLTPTAQAVAEVTTAVSGRVCLILFDDANENGLREGDETTLAGGLLELDGPTSSTHTTDGVSEPFCFEDLTAGEYHITAGAPEGYHLTSQERVAVTLTGSGEINLSFGAALGEEAPAADEAEGQGSGGAGLSPVLIVGIIAGVVALIAVIGLITFIVINQRRSVT